jgi:hypothetical protein
VAVKPVENFPPHRIRKRGKHQVQFLVLVTGGAHLADEMQMCWLAHCEMARYSTDMLIVNHIVDYLSSHELAIHLRPGPLDESQNQLP